MVFNPDFTLQVARDHQAELRQAASGSNPADGPSPARGDTTRRLVGGWIVRIGRAVEGRPPAPSRAWQA